jgi:hypothetical protein
MAPLDGDVCFTPESRHQTDGLVCPLCANSGMNSLFNQIIGE